MFRTEVMYIFPCANCGIEIKRRFLDFLGNPATDCPSCGVRMLHLPKGALEEIRRRVEKWEGDWSSVVNENLTHFRPG